jgi:hypothetical protein
MSCLSSKPSYILTCKSEFSSARIDYLQAKKAPHNRKQASTSGAREYFVFFLFFNLRPPAWSLTAASDDRCSSHLRPPAASAPPGSSSRPPASPSSARAPPSIRAPPAPAPRRPPAPAPRRPSSAGRPAAACPPREPACLLEAVRP